MAVDAIAEAGIHLVLSGHYHQAFTGDLAEHYVAIKRSILVVQAGTAISTRRRHEANSYNLLAIDGERLSCTVEAWDGARYAPAATARYRLMGARWKREL